MVNVWRLTPVAPRGRNSARTLEPSPWRRGRDGSSRFADDALYDRESQAGPAPSAAERASSIASRSDPREPPPSSMPTPSSRPHESDCPGFALRPARRNGSTRIEADRARRGVAGDHRQRGRICTSMSSSQSVRAGRRPWTRARRALQRFFEHGRPASHPAQLHARAGLSLREEQHLVDEPRGSDRSPHAPAR